MDPLSIAASVIAIIQLSGKVTSLCWEYRSAVKGARRDITRILDEVNSLRTVLESLVTLAENDDQDNEPALSTLRSLAKPNGTLHNCQVELVHLEKELRKYAPATRKRGNSTFSWPFKEKEMSNHLSHIATLKQNLQLALITDQMSTSLQCWKDVKSIKSSLHDAKIENKTRIIFDRLAPADMSSNLDEARRRREPKTGRWFLESDTFNDWKTNPGSFLWIHGIPGSGKTVLCSSIIDNISQSCCLGNDARVAYFFFDFADKNKQSYCDLLRSILSQVILKEALNPEQTKTLSQLHDNAVQSDSASLLNTLKSLLNDSRPIYLVIDALDESADRTEVLSGLNEIAGWDSPALHLLVTSREEKDIEDTLVPLVSHRTRIKGECVDEDIRTYIDHSIAKDPRLKKWSADIQKEIADALSHQCKGMFRMAACQLDTIRKCLKLSQLRKALKSLPETLYDTYERILTNLEPELAEDVQRVLHWLCFTFRPPTLGDIAEMLAVDLESNTYDPDQRIADPEDILLICGSLVTLGESGTRLKLSHFSVKEYLLSGRAFKDETAAERFTFKAADPIIAEICLTYLRSFYFSDRAEMRAAEHEHPLLCYAIYFWPEHFMRAEQPPKLLGLARGLLHDSEPGFLDWAVMGGVVPDGVWAENPDMKKYGPRKNILLYYATLIGSPALVETLLDQGADINAEGGILGNALSLAAYKHDIWTVELLLQRGADVTCQVEYWGTALQAAAVWGSPEIPQYLVDRGADVNAGGGRLGPALYIAILSGSEPLVQFLLEKGANQRQGSFNFYNPLRLGPRKGNQSFVFTSYCFDALQIALQQGNTRIVELLLQRDPTVHDRGPPCGSSINAAAANGNIEPLRILFEKYGADPKWTDDRGRTGLHIAAGVGNFEAVQYFLRLGLDANHKDARGWSPIHYAAAGETIDVLEVLLPLWDREPFEENSWTPLHLACRFNDRRTLDALLEAGMEPSTVTTAEPLQRWTLYDIALVHQNTHLVSEDGSPLHKILSSKDLGGLPLHFFPVYQDAELGIELVCDACEHVIFGPAFSCSSCPDFDYCFMCRHTADESHEHTTWVMTESTRAGTARVQEKLTSLSGNYALWARSRSLMNMHNCNLVYRGAFQS
jgi:ankyrin repeat protein